MAPERATAMDKIQAYLNTINHMLIFAVTIYITFMCWYVGPTARSWHMWLCTMGYQLLMAEGILTFYASNSWSQLHGRRTKSHLHWILQVVGAAMSIAGCVIEYYDNTRHLRSIHSLVGLISLVFLFLSLLNGVSTFWATELRHYVKPVYSKFFHNLCGLLAFIVGMVSQYYSYDTGRVIRASTKEIRVALQVVAAVTIVLTSYGALKSLYSQMRDMWSVRSSVRLPSWMVAKKS